jgi:uncharacterized integral membrane protein
MTLFISMPGDFIWLIIFVDIIWIYTIIKVATAKFYYPGQKWAWLFGVIFLHILGVLLYWFVGKRYRQTGS